MDILKQKAPPEDTSTDLQVCRVVRGIWTRRRPTKHLVLFLEPLTVTGASASCFGERDRDLLYQNVYEHNRQDATSTHCRSYCSYSRGYVCLLRSKYWVHQFAYTTYRKQLRGINLYTCCRYYTTSAVSPRRGTPRNDLRNANSPTKRLCLP